VHRYNAEGLTGLHDLTPPGPKPKLTAEQQAELAGPCIFNDLSGIWLRG
jgi:hypothetical protein